jgi:hypothetical protein
MHQASLIPGLPPLVCIVGAPRCGTTTLSRWLLRRPEICFSKVKEPHFFTLVDLTAADDEQVKQAVENGYLARYFPNCAETTKMLGEGSISYLYAPERLLPMLKVWPEARFVIAVRDPFEMLPSVHQRLLFQGDETESDLARAWRLQASRAAGRNIPQSCIDSRQLQYAEVVSLGKHVEKFFEVVGRERCYISVFDDLRTDPTSAYLSFLDFLGLPDDGFRDFRPRRPSRSFRFGWLQRLLKRPSLLTGAALAGEAFVYRLGSGPPKPPSRTFQLLMGIRSKLLQWNEKPAKREELPPELRAEVRDLLRDDVRKLSRLIGRDLDQWLGGADQYGPGGP